MGVCLVLLWLSELCTSLEIDGEYGQLEAR